MSRHAYFQGQLQLAVPMVLRDYQLGECFQFKTCHVSYLIINHSVINSIDWKCYRSSRLQMFFKIGVLKNFAIFTGKHMCWSLFLVGYFDAGHGWRGKKVPSLKICQTYSTMMKLGSYTLPKEDPKNM